MPNQADLDVVFKSLGDPSRRQVVARLATGPATVSELAEPFEMALPTVMQHLGVLEDAGVLASEKHGRVRTCRLRPEALRDAERWLGSVRTEWEIRLDRLGDLLQTRDPEETT
jgi:DNA-binding transcriptional ArsR family regulator